MTTQLLPLKSLTFDTPLARLKFKFKSQMNHIKDSIARDGLLNPLIVVKKAKKFEVIDGKKRLRALKALSKSPLFARALTKVPCIIKDSFETDTITLANDRPSLMTESELAHAILKETQKGASTIHIAERFNCSLQIVEDASSLSTLGSKVMKCFSDGSINLEQAAALATVPNPKAQWDLLQHLGPFASDETIIRAIRSGETVIELPNDNILIVPSRTPYRSTPFGRSISDPQQDIFTQSLAA